MKLLTIVATLAMSAALLRAEEWTITLQGSGPIRVGSTRAEVEQQVGESLVRTNREASHGGCHHLATASRPTLLLMVEDDRVVRVETEDSRFATAEGVRVGDTEASARAAYAGRHEARPHAYDPMGHELVVRSADKVHALVLETDGRVIVYIRAGLVPPAEYVEGCL